MKINIMKIHYIVYNMQIIVDEREHALYDCLITNYAEKSKHLEIKKQVLHLGDIILYSSNQDHNVITMDTTANENNDGTNDNSGVRNIVNEIPYIIYERKTLADLLASIKDGRYDEQSYRLLHASMIIPHNIIYIIEGSMATVMNPADRRLIYSAITSLHFFKGFSVFRTLSVNETAVLVYSMADKIMRDLQKGKQPYHSGIQTSEIKAEDVKPYCSVVKKVKKDNITSKNIGEIVLCQIPGISSVTAVAIMSNFDSFIHFMDEMRKDPSILDKVTYETNGKTRKISSACIKSIIEFLFTHLHR
jgi:ERCC4-type nuclease